MQNAMSIVSSRVSQSRSPMEPNPRIEPVPQILCAWSPAEEIPMSADRGRVLFG